MISRFTLLIIIASTLNAQTQSLDDILPLRGLAIAAPQPEVVDRFIEFINSELGPNHINTLVLRVDYNYQYTSYPNLRNENALSKEQVKQLLSACRNQGINLIPQINLLGHQSWTGTLGNLLEAYPEFDETPWIGMPEKYEWPNEDGLYCKSYCPLHPEVHKVVFSLVDEIMEVFEASAFHAGMDEVFYLGEDQCPRCSGKDKAILFANEVNLIRDHLAKNGHKLWIWGDRLLDEETTGLGMWEASENGTSPAIGMIHKDVVICDWHYERPEPTAPYFAMNGLSVISCPWNVPNVALGQVDQMISSRKAANSQLSERFLGVMHTVWRPADSFLDAYAETEPLSDGKSDVVTFRTFVNYLDQMSEK